MVLNKSESLKNKYTLSTQFLIEFAAKELVLQKIVLDFWFCSKLFLLNSSVKVGFRIVICVKKTSFPWLDKEVLYQTSVVFFTEWEAKKYTSILSNPQIYFIN